MWLRPFEHETEVPASKAGRRMLGVDAVNRCCEGVRRVILVVVAVVAV